MPISPESHYCLMGMYETLEITADIMSGIYELMNYDLDGVYDNMPNYYPATQSASTIVTGDFDVWYSDTAVTSERDYVNWRLITDSSSQINEVITSTTNSIIEDPTVTVTSTNDVIHYVRYDTTRTNQWVGNFNTRINRALTDTTSDLTTTVYWSVERFMRSGSNISDYIDVNHHTKTPRRIESIRKNKIKKARKAAVKGINLFKRLFGDTKIKSFLSGNSFIVEGERYNYCIKPKNNVISHTMNPNSIHIPYHLEVLTKSGILLGTGCTTFKNTPVIDQLIAFMLHIKEDEENVIKNMNIGQRTDAYHEDDWLKDIKKNKLRERIIEDVAETSSPAPTPDRSIRERIIRAVEGISVEEHEERNRERDELRPLVAEAVEDMIEAPPHIVRQITDASTGMDEMIEDARVTSHSEMLELGS